jgi:hypothetical protein
MRDREKLMRGLRVSWPVNVEREVLSACGGTRTYTTQYSGSTLRAVGLDLSGGVVIASDEGGKRLGVCGLSSALAAMDMDWPVTVTGR